MYVKDLKNHDGGKGFYLRELLLNEYMYVGKPKKAKESSGEVKSEAVQTEDGETISGKPLLAYMYSKHFQDKIRVFAHAGALGKDYECPYCTNSGLVLSKEKMDTLKDQLAKFGNIKIKDVIEKGLKDILSLEKPAIDKALADHPDYSLVSFLYHLDKSKFHRAFKFRAEIRRKTQDLYLKSVNGVDVEALTYADIKKDVEEVCAVYKELVVGCPACQGFGYLDVGHKDPAGKANQLVLELYKRYSENPKGRITYEELWKLFRYEFKVEPQIATRPTSHWLDTKVFQADVINIRSGQLKMANQFKEFTNAMQSSIKLALARVRHLIETGTYLADQGMITFEQAFKFYDKLLQFVRIDTDTLRQSLITGEQELRARFTELKGNDSVKVERDGIIQHVIPENFLWIAGSANIQRTGKAGYRLKKGRRVYHKSTPEPRSNKYLVYAAFYSDLEKFGYNVRPWGQHGKQISEIAKQIFRPEQMRLLKVFPQLYEG